MGDGRTRQALAAFGETARSPNLRRAQLSFGGEWAAEWALTVALGILAFRDGGATAVGVVATARMLPAALLAPFAGFVVDRYRRERVLVAICLVRGVALGAAALTLATLDTPVPAYVLAALATLPQTLYRPAHSALLPSLCTTPAQLTGANVVRGLLDSLSALLGPLVVATLVGPLGIDGVLAICAVVTVWAGWLAGRVDYEAPPRITTVHPGNAARDALQGLAVLKRLPDVRVVSLLMCLQTVTRGSFAVFSVVLAFDILGTGESGVGVLTAGFGAGAVLGSFASSLLAGRTGFARWLGVGVAFWGLPFVFLGLVSTEVLALALLAVVGVANALVDVTGFTLLQRLVPDEVMGRYFAVLESLFTLGVAIGSILTSGLIALLGTRGAFIAGGLITPAGVAIAWIRLRRLDEHMHVSDRVVGLLQQVPFLQPLPLASLAGLAAGAEDERVPSGTVVIEEGTPGDDFFVIAGGRARVSVDGRDVVALEGGECFGEIAALGRERRTSTVTAETELELLRLTGRHLITAVTGYTPSRAAASALVEQRLDRAVSSRA